MKICDILNIYALNDNVGTEDYEETWNLDDGIYHGRIAEFKQVKNGTKYLLKVAVDSQRKVYLNVSPVSRYEYKPMCGVVEELTNIEAATGRSIEFGIRNTAGNAGNVFSNITEVRYI